MQTLHTVLQYQYLTYMYGDSMACTYPFMRFYFLGIWARNLALDACGGNTGLVKSMVGSQFSLHLTTSSLIPGHHVDTLDFWTAESWLCAGTAKVNFLDWFGCSYCNACCRGVNDGSPTALYLGIPTYLSSLILMGGPYSCKFQWANAQAVRALPIESSKYLACAYRTRVTIS